jgi:hypothetical protein
MIDAWEIFGRLLTDDVFREQVFQVAGEVAPPVVNQATRAEFCEGDYEILRKALRPQLSGPVSLSTLGELLWALVQGGAAFQDSINNMADVITSSGVETASNNRFFYMALGALTIDETFRTGVLEDVSMLASHEFLLSADEIDALLGVFNFRPTSATVDPPALLAANNVCRTVWDQDCNLHAVYWNYPNYPHSQPVPLTSLPYGAPPVQRDPATYQCPGVAQALRALSKMQASKKAGSVRKRGARKSAGKR